MATRVASLEAFLGLDSTKYQKDLKQAKADLGTVEKSVKDFDKASDKLADSLGDVGKKGRTGFSAIDQGAINAKGSIVGMFSVLGGGAAQKAEGVLNSGKAALDHVGKAAMKAKSSIGDMFRSVKDKAFQAFGKAVDKVFRRAGDGADDVKKKVRETGEEAKGASLKLADLFKLPGLDKLEGLMKGGPIALIGAIGAAAVGVAVGLGKAGAESQRVTKLISASTGATGKELDVLGKTADRVFIRGFGENAEDAARAVVTVKQVLGETGREAENTAVRALTLRDVFSIDVPESVRAARAASRTFGDETQKTFDLITATAQQVGDPYGDLADTVTEYSADLAQAGFSQEEFFGILARGVSEGARNFDVLADLVREFTIRIADGSDTTKDALNDLFAATGQGGQEYFDLKQSIVDTSMALEDNKQALDDSKGAFEVQSRVVDDLERALSDAQRQLDELSRPKLKGMDEFDDKLFGLEQQSKRLQLALLDLDEESPAFEKTQSALDELNKEIDRVSLERELTIEPQLRAIEKAAMEGREPIVSYEEALANVAAKRTEIEGLEKTFNDQRAALEPLAEQYHATLEESERLTQAQKDMQSQLEDMVTPADEFLQALADGDMTTRDAMSEIIQMLSEVNDQVVADQLAVDLFGTKAEELGLDIVLALDPAVNKMTEFEGATDRAAQTITSGLGPALEKLKRTFTSTIGEFGEMLIEGDVGGIVDRVTEGIGIAVPALGRAAIKSLPDALENVVPSFGIGGVVPGPVGAPMLVEAHGGETITPPGQSQAPIIVNINAPIYGEQGIRDVVNDSFMQLSAVVGGG